MTSKRLIHPFDYLPAADPATSPTAKVVQTSDGLLALEFESTADYDLALRANERSHNLRIAETSRDDLGEGPSTIKFKDSVDLPTLVRHYQVDFILVRE